MEEKKDIEISEAVRTHISLMNEKERQELLRRINEEDEKKQQQKKEKRGFSLRNACKGFRIFSGRRDHNDLEHYSSADFADQIAQTKKEEEGATEGVAEKEEAKKEEALFAPEVEFAHVLESCSEDYAIFVYGILPEDAQKDLQAKCLQAGIDILGVPVYPIRNGMYAGLLSDCWNNQNAINQIQEELQKELADETGMRLTVVTLGAQKRKTLAPAMCLQRLVVRLQQAYDKAQVKKSLDTEDLNMQQLITKLRKEIEKNAIEQARRQFEQQMEENGELIPEQPVVIREAASMSAVEYDSYLSQEEQLMKREAKMRYIDDDVSIAQVLHNIEKHRTLDDPLYLIAIASVDMNTLVLLEDTEDFEALCRESDVTMIQCSYIYAISRSGGHWYGNNHATKEIENIFSGLSEVIVQNGGRFRREYLYRVPNISIFKDIYMQ